MNATAWILLILLFGGLVYTAAFRVGARLGKRKNHRSAAPHSRTSKLPLRAYQYRAVELQICNNPCEASLAIAGKRLLKSEAPSLPLEGCPYEKCHCTYTQYDDRRLMQRRIESSPYGRAASWQSREERRKGTRDRRGRSPV
ncbi:MAG: hypothetical protein LBE22_12810 [Azoarcus sp.]|jgi:hypothetical protein|nr:hypothetical protein [Azoarcus sp.]